MKLIFFLFYFFNLRAHFIYIKGAKNEGLKVKMHQGPSSNFNLK